MHVSYKLLSKCSTKAAVVLKTNFVLVGKAMCSDTGFVFLHFISGGKFSLKSRAAKAKLVGLVPFHASLQCLKEA